jgi:hypothetical protein
LNIAVPVDDTDFVQHDKDSVVFWVVFQSLLATYNTELPKNETEVLKEVSVMTIPIVDLKTIMEESMTLDEVFLNGLPYMDSHLIRTFMIQILRHHFLSGNKGKLDSLLCRLRTFELKFTREEQSYCEGLFAYINAPLPDIPNLASYVVSDEELFVQIKDSLVDDRDWTDVDVSVIKSESKVKKVQQRFKFVKAKAPIDSGMACGGGAAVAVESESEEEEEEEEPVEASIEQELVEDSVRLPFDATHLQGLLSSDERLSAIEYLLSVELGDFDETLQAAIRMLKNETITCYDVIQGLSQRGIFDEED